MSLRKGTTIIAGSIADTSAFATKTELNTGLASKQDIISDLSDYIKTSAISKAQNGYVKLSNGIIIQWGTTSNGGTFSFPTAFTGAYTGVACGYSGSGSGYASTFFRPVSNTTFTISGDFGETATRYWIAVGY